jgi:hypothetical protein
MALTYSSINIEQPSQEGGGSNPPFVATFNIGGWILSGSEYSINISGGTHGRGNDLVIQVYELVGSEYEIVDIVIDVAATGDIKIKTNQIPDTRFAGRVLISGE